MRAAPPLLYPARAVGAAQTRLIGRTEELNAAVSSVESNGGAVIVGPVGIGKTALANAAARAVQENFHVVHIRGSAFSAGTPYGALGWLLSEMPDTPLGNPVQVLRALKTHLDERAEGRRTLLVVDNFHELDDLSQRATVQLMRQSSAAMLATTPDLLLCREELVRLWAEGMIRRIDLAPLGTSDSVALMEQVAGGRLSALAAHTLWRQTRGNPLFTSLLCRDQVAAGRLKERGGIRTLAGPLSYNGEISDWLESWYSRLSGPERRVVDLASLCPGIPLPVLLDMADAQAVETLEEQGVLEVSHGDGSVRVRDPLYARLVAERVPLGHFFELWQELLGARLDPASWADGPARAFAEWSATAGNAVDPALAGRACAAANLDGEPDAALRIAAAVQEPGPHPRLQLERARALRALNQVPAAEAELLRLVELQDPATLVPALLELAQTARSLPRPQLAPLQALAQAEAAAAALPEPTRLAMLQQVTAVRASLAVLNGVPHTAPADLGALCLDWTVPATLVLPARASRCQLLALAGRTQEAQQEAADLWERLQQVQDFPLSIGAQVLNGILCTYITCAEPVRSLELLAQARQVPYVEAHLSAWSEVPAGAILAVSGRADTALGYLVPAHRQLEVEDPLELLPLALAAMAYCYALRRDWDRMSEHLAAVPAFKAVPPSNVLAATRYFQLAAALRFHANGEAAAQLAEQGRLAAGSGGYPLAVLCLSTAALAGDAAAAKLLETTAETGDGPDARVWQRLGAGLWQGSSRALFDAAEGLLARGLYLQGHEAALAAQEAAESGSQRELAREARIVANECYRMLADANSLQSRMAELSDFERDLAGRAASGASSARLGSALHLSPRTVDWHLGRIFQKLHVSGRAELRRLLGDGAGTRERDAGDRFK